MIKENIVKMINNITNEWASSLDSIDLASIPLLA